MKNPIILLLFFSCLVSSVFGQETDCGFEIDPESSAKFNSEYKAYTSTRGRPALTADEQDLGTLQIPFVAHIIRKADGTGGTTKAKFQASLDRANNHYKSIGVSFVLCRVNFIDNDAYYNYNKAETRNADSGIAETNNIENSINLYCFPNSGTSWANFPYDNDDFIVMLNSQLENESTLSHELGHYFGLYHTHETWFGTDSDGSDCDVKGDYICDTPVDSYPRQGSINSECNYTGTEANPPDVNNIMSYSPKRCRTKFSSQQAKRMIYAFLTARNYLNNGCGSTNGLIVSEPATIEITNASGIKRLTKKITKSYTKEAWVKLSSTRNGKNNNLISGIHRSPYSKHAFWISKHHNYHLSAGHNGGWSAVKAPNPFPSGWHHVAVTYNANSTTMKLYQDGVLVSTNTNVPNFTGDGIMQIGGYDYGNELNGEIKHVKVWDYVRTDQQIENSGILVSKVDKITINNATQGENLDVKLTDSYTKEAWVKLSSTDNQKDNNIISGNTNSKHYLWIPKDYSYHLAAGHNDSHDHVKASTPFPSDWHHVAVSYDAPSTTMKLYQDGVLVSTNTNVPKFEGDGFMEIGRFGDAHEINGEISQMTIWGYARSEQQIREKATGVTIDAPDLITINNASDGQNLNAKLSASYTKEAWVRLATLSNGKNNNIVSGGGLTSEHALWISQHHNYCLAAGHNNKWDYVQAPNPFPSGWHHVAVTYDATNKTMKLYQDGDLVDTEVDVPPFIGVNGFMQIGRYNNANEIIGEIKKVVVWNYARTDRQITDSKNSL